MTPITHVCDTYLAARELPYKQTPMRQTFKDIATGIAALATPLAPTLTVAASIGQGAWATHPWVTVIDRRITDSVRYGMCLGMSWNADMSGFTYGIFLGMEGLRAATGPTYHEHAIERLTFIAQAAGVYADAFPITHAPHVYTRFSFSPHTRWLGFAHPRDRLPDNRTVIQTYLFTLAVYTAIVPAWRARYGDA